MVDPIVKRIQTGEYVIGKDVRGREWAGFFERLDRYHVQIALIWAHVGGRCAELREVLAETLEPRHEHAPNMHGMCWDLTLNGRLQLCDLLPPDRMAP